jgi:hypothetical protein
VVRLLACTSGSSTPLFFGAHVKKDFSLRDRGQGEDSHIARVEHPSSLPLPWRPRRHLLQRPCRQASAQSDSRR